MSETRKAWLKGLASGIILSVVLALWSPEWLFGERNLYTETDRYLDTDLPSVSSRVLGDIEPNLGNGHRDTDSDAPEISLFTLQPLFHVTPSNVRSVCIARAELNVDGTERWTAQIKLKDPNALINAVKATGVYEGSDNQLLGMLKFSEPWMGHRQNFSMSRFNNEAILDAVDRRTCPHDFEVHFNEKYVPDVSQALLALTEDYKVPPCPNLTNLTIYDRWQDQWLNSEPGKVKLSQEWIKKHR